MSWYTRLFDPVVFDPELLAVVQQAFDAAWTLYASDYGAAGSTYEDAREVLAKAIIECAQDGQTDVNRMKSYGLEALMRFRNSPPAAAQ